MGSKLYVGNLSYNVTCSELEQLFSQYGTVENAQIIADRDSGRSKGLGFVQMGSRGETQTAIETLDGQQFNGRTLSVNVAKPREERPRNGGFGRPRNGGFGNRKRF